MNNGYLILFFSFVIKAFGFFSAILFTFMITNLFEPVQSGILLLIISFVQIFGNILTFGGMNIILKTVGADHDSNWLAVNSLVNFLLLFSLTFSMLFVFLGRDFYGVILDTIDKNELYDYILPMLFASLAFALIQLLSSALQGRGEIIRATVTQNLISQSCFLILLVIFYLADAISSISFVVYLYVFSLVFCCLISFFFWFLDKNISYSICFETLRSRIKGWWVFLSILYLNMCIVWGGYLSVSYFLGYEDMAAYVAAHKVSISITFFLISASYMVAPKFSKAYVVGNIKEVDRLALWSTRAVLAFSLPILFFLYVFSPFIMSLFGPEEVYEPLLLKVLLIGQLFNVASGSVGYLLNMTGNEKVFRNNLLISGVLSVFFYGLLTSFYGVVGACIACSLSIFIQTSLNVISAKKSLGFNCMNVFRRV